MFWIFIKAMSWLVGWSLCPPEGLLRFTESPYLSTYSSAAVLSRLVALPCVLLGVVSGVAEISQAVSVLEIQSSSLSSCLLTCLLFLSLHISFRNMVPNYLAGFLWEINMVSGMKSGQLSYTSWELHRCWLLSSIWNKNDAWNLGLHVPPPVIYHLKPLLLVQGKSVLFCPS